MTLQSGKGVCLPIANRRTRLKYYSMVKGNATSEGIIYSSLGVTVGNTLNRTQQFTTFALVSVGNKVI